MKAITMPLGKVDSFLVNVLTFAGDMVAKLEGILHFAK